MSGTTDESNQDGGDAPTGPRATPIAAIAGAIVLAGLAGFAIYRRATGPAAPVPPEGAPAAGAAQSIGTSTPATQPPPDDPDAPRGAPAAREQPAPAETPATGTPIVAQAPMRLSPEANIMAERYRCVCGCNDPLGLCTCRLSRGSEEMKTALKALTDQHLLPEEIDRAMTATFGAAALLSNPAPPQTQPSHVTGAPPKKKIR